MKKLVSLLLALAMLFTGVFALAEEDGTNVLVLVPSLGDGSYFAAAALGAEALVTRYPGTTVDAIAMGAIPMDMANAEYELATYLPFFTEACESGKYDLIITCGAECNHALLAAAKAYPNQLFVSVDLQGVPAELAEAPLTNVYGVTYKVKDLGYLAGYVACAVTTSNMEKANPEKKVGVIVGMDFPGLNEYIGGFVQVCAENGVEVYIDYAGDFIVEIAPQVAQKARAMYDAGVDVIWQVAGGAGSGVFTAAKEADKYAFGVDCDQAATIADPAEAATIVTSFYSDYAAVIDYAYSAMLAGSFPGGTYPQVGLAEGFVGYADNAQFRAMASPEVVDGIAALYEKMASGEVEVFSVEADPEGWEALKQATAPAN
ncbi:MAG: BMP family ABC transporter substrate-binding protein [Clostridia bacterium]|nr:BMP family ABC transporter substrate-binding protein [Clostridia bacterium]